LTVLQFQVPPEQRSLTLTGGGALARHRSNERCPATPVLKLIHT